MLTSHDILWGIVVPLTFAAIVIVIGHFAQRGPGVTPWAVTLAIAGGFAIAFIGVTGKFSVPPVGAQEWLPLMGAAAVVVSIVATLARRRRWPAALSIVLLVTSAWLLTRGRTATLSPKELRQLLAIAISGAVIWWLLMEPLATKMHGATLPVLLSGIVGGAAFVIIGGRGQSPGQIEGGIALVLLAIAGFALWLRDLSLARGGMLAITIAGVGVLWWGYLFATSVKGLDVAILVVAPLFAWVSQVPGVRGRRPWVRFSICAILVWGFALIAILPALKEVRQTMKEQAESVEY